MATIPQGKTWFDTHTKSFVNIEVGADKSIPTSDFLDAAQSTATLFDLLGSAAFTPVKKDMTGNVKKVRDRQLAAPDQSATLQSLVKNELATKSHKATEGLLWLVRGLDFTAQAMRADLSSNAGVAPTEPKPKKELAESFRTAYQGTLAQHHGFLVKQIFNAAMGAAPYRKDFAAKLVGPNTPPEQAQADLEKWVSALEEQVAILKAFLASPEAKW